jgi:NADPH-dependent glutamate synthase beta subunit-like oxidoreductase
MLLKNTKQYQNGSTEGELIGIYNALPSILHAKYFLKALGYTIKQNIIYQENKSSITLEKNGKTSSSKRMKHINVHFFLNQGHD